MLVAFEGIDGSGKTTAMRRVAARLKREGHAVVVTREPTPSWLGRALRRGIRERIDPVALCALFLADRAQHVADLKPHLAAGAIVLTDRYSDSTTAYQGVTLQGLHPGALGFLARLQGALFPRPDLVLWFDLPPKAAVARLQSRRVREPFEKVKFLEKVRRNYAALAHDSPHWVRIDAGKEPQATAQAAYAAIRRGLGPPRQG